MSFEVIHTDKAPNPVGPYSQAVQAGPFLFCSGQIAIDPKTNQVLNGPVEQQAKLVMENIKNVLKASELTLKNVFKAI